MMRRLSQPLLLALVAGVALAAGPARADGDATHGKQVFQQCSICHSTEAGEQKLGPSLFDVVGRKAGSEQGFRYSSALQKLGDVTWTPDQLDKWLQGPSKMAPGTAMAFQLSSDKDRADVIAYLATLK
jgi:cytochrome c